jgi:ribonuclease G
VAAYINKGMWSLGLQWRVKYAVGMKVIPDQSLAFLEYKFYDGEKNELGMQEEKEMK